MEEVDFSRLEIMIELTFFEKFYTLPQNHGFVHTRSIRTFLGFWRKRNSSTFRMSAHCLKILFKKSHLGVSEASYFCSNIVDFSFYIEKKSRLASNFVKMSLFARYFKHCVSAGKVRCVK